MAGRIPVLDGQKLGQVELEGGGGALARGTIFGEPLDSVLTAYGKQGTDVISEGFVSSATTSEGPKPGRPNGGAVQEKDAAQAGDSQGFSISPASRLETVVNTLEAKLDADPEQAFSVSAPKSEFLQISEPATTISCDDYCDPSSLYAAFTGNDPGRIQKGTGADAHKSRQHGNGVSIGERVAGRLPILDPRLFERVSDAGAREHSIFFDKPTGRAVRDTRSGFYEWRHAWARFADGKRRHVLLTVRYLTQTAEPPRMYSLKALEVRDASEAFHDAQPGELGAETSAATDLDSSLAAFMKGVKPEHRAESEAFSTTAARRTSRLSDPVGSIAAHHRRAGSRHPNHQRGESE